MAKKGDCGTVEHLNIEQLNIEQMNLEHRSLFGISNAVRDLKSDE